MTDQETRVRKLMRKLNMKFALPGIIGLFILAFIHHLLPGSIRFYAFASVVITLLLGLLTGEFRILGIQLAAAKSRHDPEQTLNRRQMIVAVGGIFPTIIIAILSTVEGYQDLCLFAFFVVVAIGAILLYFLRDKPPANGTDSSDNSTSSAPLEPNGSNEAAYRTGTSDIPAPGAGDQIEGT